MDIWDWVFDLQENLYRAGESRLAKLIDDISTFQNENLPERVDAVFPEALAGARAIKNPWLEIYFRHWNLQSRLENKGEGESALPEAISLVEFAHREANVACPQSICAANNLCSCYTNIDAPGWAEEQLAAYRETLARINASWQCFDCLSIGYARALLSIDRVEEAAAFAKQQRSRWIGAGNSLTDHFQELQAELQYRQGQLEKALKAYARIERHTFNRLTQSRCLTAQALILAQLGRFAEAERILPDWSAVAITHIEKWSLAFELIALANPKLNTWQMGAAWRKAIGHLVQVGAPRRAFMLTTRHARLAVARGALWNARFSAEIAQQQMRKLRADYGAAAILASVHETIDAYDKPAPPSPVEPTDLLAHLAERNDRDPEQEYSWIVAAIMHRPDDESLHEALISALHLCEMHEEVQHVLWRFIRSYPKEDSTLAAILLDELIKANDDIGISQLIEIFEQTQPLYAHWARARFAYSHQKWAEAIEQCRAIVALSPNVITARQLWADAAFKLDDFQTMLQVQLQLRTLNPDSANPCIEDWAVLVAASLAEDWQIVRDTAAKLGYLFAAGDGPIDENWGWIRIRYDNAGYENEAIAVRTGPATARILSIDGPDEIQHYGDHILFDPYQLDPEPEEGDGNEEFIGAFQHLYTAKPGHTRSWCIDGANPGEEAWETFYKKATALGWGIWIKSNDDYRVTHPEDETIRLKGLFFLIAVPDIQTPSQVNTLLTELTRDWKHPVAWLGLAQAAGVNLDRHYNTIERYCLCARIA